MHAVYANYAQIAIHFSPRCTTVMTYQVQIYNSAKSYAE